LHDKLVLRRQLIKENAPQVVEIVDTVATWPFAMAGVASDFSQ
jgi:hypothetical protein